MVCAARGAAESVETLAQLRTTRDKLNTILTENEQLRIQVTSAPVHQVITIMFQIGILQSSCLVYKKFLSRVIPLDGMYPFPTGVCILVRKPYFSPLPFRRWYFSPLPTIRQNFSLKRPIGLFCPSALILPFKPSISLLALSFLLFVSHFPLFLFPLYHIFPPKRQRRYFPQGRGVYFLLYTPATLLLPFWDVKM